MSSRLDLALAARGLARSRAHARQLIDSGQVLINDRSADKASVIVGDHDRLSVRTADHYVSRAAHKLLGALTDFRPTLTERIRGSRVLDAGASTGGFTQVLLESGARQVIAIDVGHDQLHDSLRTDPRVQVHDRVNVRDLDLGLIGGEPVDLVVADLSFISLVLVLPRLSDVVSRGGELLLMIKPQFEVGRELLGPGGVVRDRALHRQAVTQVLDRAAELGWRPTAAAPSRLPGPAGNVEFFVLLTRRPTAETEAAIDVWAGLGLRSRPPG